MNQPQWNLEQIRLFVKVAQQRSFSAVARDLHRAQSAVSSAVALLEEDLGVILFERSSGRQPQLTEAGLALLDEAQELLRQCERLDGRALALMRGQEAQLRLAQDEAMPYQPVIASLEAFAGAFSGVQVQLANAAQGDVARRLVDGQADLGLLFRHEQMPAALERRALGRVEMVTVCSSEHPLAREARVDRQQLARHRQLLIAQQSSGFPGGEAISPQVWRADSFYMMAEMLRVGLGWAWLPRHVVQYPTYQGDMVELASDWAPPPLLVELAWRRDAPPGPAGQWLAQRLAMELRAIG